MVGGPPSQARPAAPARVVGSTVMTKDLRRQVRFKAGVRDLCFGAAIALVGVLMQTLVPVFVGSPQGTRVAGIGLIVVGVGYAGFGVYGMVTNRASAAPSAGQVPQSRPAPATPARPVGAKPATPSRPAQPGRRT